MARLINLAYYIGAGASLVAGLSVIFGRGRPPRWAVLAAAAGTAIFLIATAWIVLNPPAGVFDFAAFYESGGEVLAGRDPIDRLQTAALPPLNPPSAFPLFAAFASGRIEVTFAVWTIANALMGFALVFLADRVLRPSLPDSSRLPITALLILASLLALSNATRACLGAGQLSIVTAFAILAALLAQSRAKSVQAGTWLAFATMKIGTLVPFLLLFRRRTDARSWLTMAVVTAGLCLTTGRIVETPKRVGRWLDGIGRMSADGNVNDFTYAAPDNGDMIGLDHAFYRAGLKSRTSAKLAQGLIVIILGLAVAWSVFRIQELSEGAKQSLVALFAMLFLYHRLSDAVILVLPLLYTTARARVGTGRSRLLYLGSALALIPILFMQRSLMKSLRDYAERGGGLARIVEVFLLPYACWLLIAAMIMIGIAEHLEVRRIHETLKDPATAS